MTPSSADHGPHGWWSFLFRSKHCHQCQPKVLIHTTLSAEPTWITLFCAGLPLTGNRTYKITFPAAPPHDPRAFWSVQVFDLEKLTYPGVGANGYGAGYLALKASGRECLLSGDHRRLQLAATRAGQVWLHIKPIIHMPTSMNTMLWSPGAFATACRAAQNIH